MKVYVALQLLTPYVISCYLAAKATRTHFYFTMTNNSGDAEQFREQLLNVVEHYNVRPKFTCFSPLPICMVM